VCTARPTLKKVTPVSLRQYPIKRKNELEKVAIKLLLQAGLRHPNIGLSFESNFNSHIKATS